MAGNVLILGAGPAGLLAAHAVEQLGGKPTIASRASRESAEVAGKSVFQGAQYLQAPIAGLTFEPDGVIRTYKHGTAAGYAKKVYGDPAAPCSWDDQPPEREAWDLRAAYDRLWERYQERILPREITRHDLDMLSVDPGWSLVISTLPAIHVCYQRDLTRAPNGVHHFDWESMWTIDYAPPEVMDNTVLYSGDQSCSWYRASRVFGHAATEWSDLSPPLGGAYLTPEQEKPPLVYIPQKGIKVKGTNCDCWPNIKRVGRFGTWRKGYLSHHAYHDAARLYEEATA